MDEYITREEHNEFCKRMEDEHHRQSRRTDEVEKQVQQIRDLAVSVQKLATNMEAMLKEQEQQGQRLETLEKRDGDMWRKFVGYCITAVISCVIGYMLHQIGM